VGQLYWPDVVRMGLYHDDVIISTSLFEPVSTLISVVAWALLLLVAIVLLQWRWGRYLVFAMAWFIVGHSIESTVLPLELYFEHRNYFPGIGLVLVIGVLCGALIKKFPPVKAPLLVYLGVYVLLLSTQTSSQVQIWSSHPLLILNHLNAHPHSYRANTDMAVQLAKFGDFEAARKYSEKAFSLGHGERRGDNRIRDLALSCISNQSVEPSRIDAVGTVNSARPLSSPTTLYTLVHLLQDNACPKFDRIMFADRMALLFLGDTPPATASKNIYFSLAVLENVLQRYDNAYDYTEKYLVLSPANKRALLMKLHFSTALGKVEEVEAVKALLKNMEEQGELTIGEQQTLSLYLES
jgi:hypothetical protein